MSTTTSTSSQKEQRERIVSLFALGVLQAVRNGWISNREAELLLFSPKFIKLAENGGYSEKLLNVITTATEIDDVSRLAPTGLESCYKEIEDTIQEILQASQPSSPELPSQSENLFFGS
jgi:hypothetical protein